MTEHAYKWHIPLQFFFFQGRTTVESFSTKATESHHKEKGSHNMRQQCPETLPVTSPHFNCSVLQSESGRGMLTFE